MDRPPLPKCDWCSKQLEYGNAAVSVDWSVERFMRNGSICQQKTDWLIMLCGPCGNRLDISSLRTAIGKAPESVVRVESNPIPGHDDVPGHDCFWCEAPLQHNADTLSLHHHIQQFEPGGAISVISGQQLVTVCRPCSKHMDLEIIRRDLSEVHRLPEGPSPELANSSQI